VALSRVQSLDGLYLSDFQPHRIAANPSVHDFYKNIPSIDMSIDVSSHTMSFEEYELKEEPMEESTVKRVTLH
jgi:hypothetical protein